MSMRPMSRSYARTAPPDTKRWYPAYPPVAVFVFISPQSTGARCLSETFVLRNFVLSGSRSSARTFASSAVVKRALSTGRATASGGGSNSA